MSIRSYPNLDIVTLLVSVAFPAHAAKHSYLWWFWSTDQIVMTTRKRRGYWRNLPFTPQNLLFGFYDQNPRFEDWINKLLGLMLISTAIGGVRVAIMGPF
jgi:hypothetical protein